MSESRDPRLTLARIQRRLANKGIGVLITKQGYVAGVGRYNRDWVLPIVEGRMLP